MEFRFLGNTGLRGSELCLGAMTFGKGFFGLSRKHIMASCEASLKRLGTDHIDLYQIHGWDNLTEVWAPMSTR